MIRRKKVIVDASRCMPTSRQVSRLALGVLRHVNQIKGRLADWSITDCGGSGTKCQQVG